MSVRLDPESSASRSTEGALPAKEARHVDDRRDATTKSRWGPPAICCGLYVVLTMLLFGHFGSLGPSHMTGTRRRRSGRSGGSHGPHSPFPTSTVCSWPNGRIIHSGQNFGVNGSMLALGVLFMPITKLFGPVVTWNIALRLAVATSAASMCFVLRRWTTWWPAAFVGGLIYGFSAYTGLLRRLPVSHLRAATTRDLPTAP